MTTDEKVRQDLVNCDVNLGRARASSDRYEALYKKAQHLLLVLHDHAKNEDWDIISRKLADYRRIWEQGK